MTVEFPPVPPRIASRGGLSREVVRKLQVAPDELVECKRLLGAALGGPG
jgi:hypothetical protein